MGLSLIVRLARRAPAPVHACIGPGMLAAAERALLSPALRPALSPRGASVLLIAGPIPVQARAALDRVHDQLPHPRATLFWDGNGDVAAEAQALWRDLLEGRESDPDRNPDAPPNEWEGKGDHGQGGEGMMGGVPYGRPMTMTGPDIRDGLQLDAYSARIGPFAPMLAPGLQLDVTLQGDVIVEAQVAAPPWEQPAEADNPALCAARMLRLLGLGPAADRVAQGRAPRAMFPLRAVPPGLAQSAGRDARARLADWLAGRAAADAAPDPAALLPGLEWSEAMLALASFSPGALRKACRASAEAA